MYVVKASANPSKSLDGKRTFSPYFVIKTPADEYEVWTPSTKDLFAEDWYVV